MSKNSEKQGDLETIQKVNLIDCSRNGSEKPSGCIQISPNIAFFYIYFLDFVSCILGLLGWSIFISDEKEDGVLVWLRMIFM